jgi:hypothetical protein
MAHQAHRRLGGEHASHRAEFLRRPPVIAIQESHDFALCLWNAGVERRRLAAIGLAQQAHARREPLHDAGSTITRPIIHHQDFCFRWREILLKNTGDGLLDESLVIVRID